MATATKLTRLLLKFAKSTETADFIECQTSDGTVKWKVDKDGNMTGGSLTAAGSLTVPTGQTAAVADADSLTVGAVIVPQQIECIIRQNAAPATECGFIANAKYQLTAVRYRHHVKGTDAGAVTLQLTKDPSGTAPGAGTALLTNNTNAGFDCKGTNDTNQVGTLTATTASLQLAVGDAISLAYTGALSTLAGVCLTLSFKRIA